MPMLGRVSEFLDSTYGLQDRYVLYDAIKTQLGYANPQRNDPELALLKLLSLELYADYASDVWSEKDAKSLSLRLWQSISEMPRIQKELRFRAHQRFMSLEETRVFREVFNQENPPDWLTRTRGPERAKTYWVQARASMDRIRENTEPADRYPIWFKLAVEYDWIHGKWIYGKWNAEGLFPLAEEIAQRKDLIDILGNE